MNPTGNHLRIGHYYAQSNLHDVRLHFLQQNQINIQRLYAKRNKTQVKLLICQQNRAAGFVCYALAVVGSVSDNLKTHQCFPIYINVSLYKCFHSGLFLGDA